MLNAIGLANPGREVFLAETLPQLRALNVPLWVSVGGFAAHEYAETCARLRRRDDRVEPQLPERRRGTGVGCGDRRGVPRGDRKPALRQGFAALVGHGGDGARGRGRGRRRRQPGQHAARRRARCASSSEARARRRRLLGTGVETGRARRGSRGATRDRVADRRHGRRVHRTRRARVDRVRRDARRARHGAVRRPGCARARARGARRRSDDAPASIVRPTHSASRSTALPAWQTRPKRAACTRL